MAALVFVLVWVVVVSLIAALIVKVVGATRLARWLRLPSIDDDCPPHA